MRLNIVNTGIPLMFSASFISQLEEVVNRNVDSSVTQVALFISRIIKGLQALSRSEGTYNVSWGTYSYSIEDIGVVHFQPLMDMETGDRVYHILSIQWTFATSRFFAEMKS